jgi:hypothetical protein
MENIVREIALLVWQLDDQPILAGFDAGGQ